MGEGGWGRAADRPDAFMSPRDFSDRASFDNGVRNYGGDRGLVSDGGFNNALSSAAGARGYNTWRATPSSLANIANPVRNNFHNYGAFRNNWWNRYPYAWRRDWGDYWPWGWGSWGGFAGLWGVPLSSYPVYYDYGDNITYDSGGNVDYGSDVVCSGSDYYQQAQELANSGQNDDAPTANISSNKQSADGTVDGWKSFGVYSLVQGGQSNSSTLFQLCSNKAGQIRGNYYNALTDETQPVKGSIDKKRMRAAWTVGKDTNVVYDTGVANLLKEQSPVLIHFGKDSTQQWTLVRIKNPNAENSKSKA
jgi:hypothetical protein